MNSIELKWWKVLEKTNGDKQIDVSVSYCIIFAQIAPTNF